MLEIPCVVQGFADGKSPYQVNPDDTEHMIVVTDNTKWEGIVEHLIEDPGFIRSMGMKAKQYVLENYDINSNIEKWENAYQALLS
jgi:hypothetical protein